MSSTEERLTATGVGIGTLGYMAPEQLAGERELGGAADVYALAVVAYEMFAGQPPFSRPTVQALVAAHLTEPPPPLSTVASQVPPAISLVISRALAKSPADRYQTAAEFRDALDVPVTAAILLPRPQRRVPRKILYGGTALFVLSAVGVGMYARMHQPTLDPNYVVILPFNVQNADSTLREGMVTVLQDINGQGWVKTVPPNRYLRTWKEGADELTAARLGKRMGAGLAVFGSVIGVGRDSLSVTMSVIDVARGRQLGVRIDAAGRKENLPRLGNSLAIGLLKELNKRKPVGAHGGPGWVVVTRTAGR